MRETTLYIAKIAAIAALYATVTVVWPLSFEAIQFRLSEALIALIVWKETERETPIGMTLGTLLGNIISPYGVLDLVLGTIATFVGVTIAWYLRKRALILPLTGYILGVTPIVAVILSIYGIPFYFGFATVFLGEAVVVYGIGLPLAWRLRKISVE